MVLGAPTEGSLLHQTAAIALVVAGVSRVFFHLHWSDANAVFPS